MRIFLCVFVLFQFILPDSKAQGFFSTEKADSIKIDTLIAHHENYTTFSRRFFVRATCSFDSTLSFIWDFGDNSTDTIERRDTILEVHHKYQNPGPVTIKVKISNLSETFADSAEIQDTIRDLCNEPAVNVFTPNGDNINDQFILTTNGLTKFSYIFYSRWGNIVYKMDTPQEQVVWDGHTADGRLVEPGVYFYVITPSDGYTPPGNSNLKGFVYVFY